MMIYMQVRVSVYFFFVLVAMYMNEVIHLKQLVILQDFTRASGFYNSFFLAEYINRIGYFLYNMQIMGRCNYCFSGFICLGE